MNFLEALEDVNLPQTLLWILKVLQKKASGGTFIKPLQKKKTSPDDVFEKQWSNIKQWTVMLNLWDVTIVCLFHVEFSSSVIARLGISRLFCGSVQFLRLKLN